MGVRYADRLVVIGQLGPAPDPNLLELCSRHVESLTPPYGWDILDQRPARAAAPLGVELSA